ncbi:uncharacterized protein LOC122505583 [Leptopilina heterotoma]|uniref:uncharacterized protein LOC122505583 n=1 Tax=Leptopilina heterotoma TaxID=63436 RepID=UPI001CA84DE5|nr:uncharacterized protein LOC122505583 [Leptopilina heterotoma]
MMKIITLLFAYIAIVNSLELRDNHIDWKIRSSYITRGVNVKEITNGYEVEWLEEFDEHTNPLKVYYNYIFEDSGTREIINLDNLCSTYRPGTPEFAVQQHMLTRLANTRTCPIKKGTKVALRPWDLYSWQTNNLRCGYVDGTSYISKKNSNRAGHTPFLLSIHFTGMVVGPNCVPDSLS